MRNLLSVAMLTLVTMAPSVSLAHLDNADEGLTKGKDGPNRILVLDGSNVHNVGELQMHLGNWGAFGSYPGSANPFSEQPSAQWPAGSGVEYLYVAGLWIGALKAGVPAVTTSAYAAEFRPNQSEPRDIVYRTSEGQRGGSRAPALTADDDQDGEIDEDWLNGYDDDGDGQVDEDFAAVSKQMFACQYTDFGTASIQIYPNHNPLNLHVRQESYEWEEDRFDDFIGAVFYITNRGNDVLENMYIGFFADGDAGPRDVDNYYEDDGAALYRNPVVCTDLGPVSLDIAFCYDVDGDEGQTLGYFGIMFLDHPTDPTGENGPQRVGITTYANFSGSASYEDGGDPTNDFERYELMASETIERDATIPRDYRMLMVGGPFKEIPPDCTMKIQTCFVIGERTEGLEENGSAAVLTFEGAWFNVDNNPLTGIAGRETRIAPTGPAVTVQIDTCLYGPTQPPTTVNRGDIVYINNDCGQERLFKESCGYSDEDSSKFMTGIAGAETQIFWIVGTAPPPPGMRIDDTMSDGVAVYWDNFSETQPDVKSLAYDFEGYRVFRADNWNRPIGTNASNGPPAELWKLLFQADIVDGLGDDTGLNQYRYEPLAKIMPASRKRDLIETMKQYMGEHPGQDPPCPQGVTTEVCDTLFHLAAFEMGNLDDGRQYYRYIDRSIHRGRPYFYAVTAGDYGFNAIGQRAPGKVGDPASNFVYIEPGSPSQKDYAYSEDDVYVVPNPATTSSMQPWTLSPNNDDPTGIKVEFRNLPADQGTIRIYTLAGDLVEELPFDGRAGAGTMKWDLVSRNGQDVTSGVYLYSIETNTNAAYQRKIGKFVVIR
jgi:hypothetical protein